MSSSVAGAKRKPAEPNVEDTSAAQPPKKKKWPGVSHANRRYGPEIILREDGYVIREDERPDHVIARDQSARRPWAQGPRGGGSAGGGGGGGAAAAQADGRFEECWICGGTDHRRSECPNKGFAGDDRHSIQRKLVCLGCRRKGHVLKDCPDRGSASSASALGGAAAAGSGVTCYNCGSGEHSYLACPEARIGNGWTHASCFVCSGQGHLSRDCPKNAAHGLYPRGGGCKRCGSVRHLVRDCDAGGAAEGAQAARAGEPGDGDGDDGGDDAPQQPRPAASKTRVAPRSDEADLGGNTAVADEAKKPRKAGGGSETIGKAFYRKRSAAAAAGSAKR